LDVEYTVVVASRLAAAVYSAILKVLGDVGPKLCTACSSSVLNDVVEVCAMLM
jgi:hypothetical protein